MIIQENEFLKTYNDMSRLWEESESAGSSGSRRAKFPFEEVVEKAFAAVEKLPQKVTKAELRKSPEKRLTEDEVKYWCDLRYLLDHKAYSLGRTRSKHWYTRFLSFYRAYKAEQAILEALRGLTEFTNCKFTEEALQGVLLLDSKDARPDIQSDQGLIECKAFGVPVTVHGANVVARHSYVDLPADQSAETSIPLDICLVAHFDTLKDIYGDNTSFPAYVKILDNDIKLEAGLKEMPKGTLLRGRVEGLPVGFQAALEKINQYLDLQEVAKADKAIYTINQHADALDVTIKKLGGMPPRTDDPEDNSVEGVTKHLEDSTQTLTQLAINMNKGFV
jgi:hypothetical protein